MVSSDDEGADPAWEAALLAELRAGLAEREARGELHVERAELTADEVVTVLRSDGPPPRWGASGPVRPTTRRGRVVSVSWLWSKIFPRWPEFVAEAWVEELYPPHHPDPATLLDGVHWFRGRTPGMTPDQIDQLPPALRPPPPPSWQDDLPPGIRPEDI